MTAFVLSGGAAKGSFQVGALRYLWTELGLRPSTVVGCSVGAINGVKVAEGELGDGGDPVAELEDVWLGLRRNEDMWRMQPWLEELEVSAGLALDEITRTLEPDSLVPKFVLFPPMLLFDLAEALGYGARVVDALDRASHASSLFNIEPVAEMLRKRLRPDKVANSKIHLLLAMVSLESGRLRYVNEQGRFEGTGESVPLIDAVLASASIPVAFPPVPIAGESYVDGGVRDVLPVNAAIDAGEVDVWAVVCSSIGVPRAGSFTHPLAPANFIRIGDRAVTGILIDEVLANEVGPRGGWGVGRGYLPVNVRVVVPSFEVHGSLQIDPWLIRINMGYGFLRTNDTHQGWRLLSGYVEAAASAVGAALGLVSDAPLRLGENSDAITHARMAAAQLEREMFTGYRDSPRVGGRGIDVRPRPYLTAEARANFLRSIRVHKREIKRLVEERRTTVGGSLPDGADRWWRDYEFTTDETPPNLWGAIRNSGGDLLLEAETP